jgi:hypothetical protein
MYPCEYHILQLQDSTFHGHCFTPPLRRIRTSRRGISAQKQIEGSWKRLPPIGPWPSAAGAVVHDAVHLLCLDDKGAARIRPHLHQNVLEHNTSHLPVAGLQKLPARKLFRFL